MSDTVSFSEGNPFPARSATLRTIFDYLRERELDHPEFRALVARQDYFDAIGGWFFSDLSPDALRLLARRMDQMAEDLPAVAAHWNEEWRPVFYTDVERFRSKLAERIAQLDGPPE
jgi:hypothetical protein